MTIQEQIVELTEITRQQAEHIIDLEERLLDYEDRWEFVKAELDEMKTQKILEEGM